MPLNQQQVQQLLQPINPKRVLKDGKGQAHVAQHDVTAHLIRIFGFAGWDKEILHEELVYEEPRLRDGKPSGRWDVCYRVRLRLIVKDADGQEITHKEDGSVGQAQNQPRGDAHKLAYTSAISLAMKRAAKDLGDQYGLGLYNKGSTAAIVKATLVGFEPTEGDVQDEVEVTALSEDDAEHTADPADAARDELRDYCQSNGVNLKEVAAVFQTQHGVDLRNADAATVSAFSALLQSGVVKV